MTIKRASKAAALAFVTATMSFGGPAHAQDESVTVTTETAATTPANTTLVDNERFRITNMVTPEGSIPMMRIKQNPGYDLVNNGVGYSGYLASGDLTAEDGDRYIVVMVTGSYVGDAEKTAQFMNLIERTAQIRRVYDIPVVMSYVDGTEGDLMVRICTPTGMSSGQKPLPVVAGSDIAEIMMEIRAAHDVRMELPDNISTLEIRGN